MTPPIDVAVIGARGVGASHVAALREIPGVRVSTIVASNATTARATAEALNVSCWSSEWHDVVLDQSVSAIHICAPDDLHFQIATAALAAGKHLICEKPLTADAAQAAMLSEDAKARPGQLAVMGYKYRYSPLAQFLRDQIGQGRLGRVHDIRGSYLQNWMLEAQRFPSWRTDPGRGGPARVLLDIGTHLIDLMETVLSQHVVSLQGQVFSADAARGALVAQPESRESTDEDGAHLLLECSGGVRGIASLSQVSAAHTNELHLEIDGAAASASWTLGARETLTISDAKDTSTISLAGDSKQMTGGQYWNSAAAPDQLLAPLLAAAYGQLSEPRTHSALGPAGIPIPTFEDGARHLALIDLL